MQILFIHGNYPAQFRNLVSDLGSQGVHDVRYLTARKDPEIFPLDGVKIEKYQESEEDIQHRLGTQAIINEQITRGEIIQAKLYELILEGFRPKLIIFHGGNGLGLFLRQLLPDALLVGYFEWYFSKRCANLILNRDDLAGYNYIHSRNICTENEILNCDAGIVPTEWQASQFPAKLRSHLTTIFDGINLEFFKPADPSIFSKSVILKGENDSLTVGKGELLLSYATRGMEPIRGFPEFMRALPNLLKKLPNLKVLIGGRDRSAYGPKCPNNEGSWLKMMLNELPTLQDHERITYTGLMSYGDYRLMLQRTNLHCYFTKPFVTSWSLFEAVACGAPILCNKSPATSGTINLPTKSTLNSIEEIYSDHGIELAISILNERKKRRPGLNEEFSILQAKKRWADLINGLIMAS